MASTEHEPQTMTQTSITIEHSTYVLGQGQNVDQLKQDIESAAADGDRFVTFSVVGNREVSVLVHPGIHAVIATGTVLFDARDTGDLDSPDGGHYDL